MTGSYKFNVFKMFRGYAYKNKNEFHFIMNVSEYVHGSSDRSIELCWNTRLRCNFQEKVWPLFLLACTSALIVHGKIVITVFRGFVVKYFILQRK